MHKITVLDKIEIDRQNVVNFRLALIITDDGIEEHSKWHRSALPSDKKLYDDYLDAVDKFVTSMGYPAISKAQRVTLKKHASVS